MSNKAVKSAARAMANGQRKSVISKPAPLVPASRTMRGGRINLKAVSEVLAERGMDPTVEITNILSAVDEEGKPLLDTDTRAKILMELLQYVQPKLKSVEIRAKVAATAFDVNDDQAKRIAEEFLKASTGAGL